MEAVVEGVMGSLIGRLGDLLIGDYKLLQEAKDDITFLKAELESMLVFLKNMSDADEELDVQTKCWVKEVRELSYDIEDSINEFLHCVESEPNNSPHHGFRGFIDKCMDLLSRFISTDTTSTKVFQSLKRRVVEVSERRTRYKIDDVVSKPQNTAVDLRLLALYAETEGLVGIDGPREELIQLMMDEEGTQQLKVFSIVGFGGLGKTTLANQIYHKLEGQFQCRALVSVSQKPNIRNILRNILSQVGYVAPMKAIMKTQNEEKYLQALQEFLANKRYFLVIDDIWDETTWNFIKCALPESKNGSRVITTTRIDTVAKACCSNQFEHVYKMKSLSSQDSRRLFLKRIFGSEDAGPSNLEEVSTKILKRCGGLPLAVITVSSLLASQQNKLKENWEHVLNSLGTRFELNPTLEGMRQILRLSYTDLPLYLKTCMLYLGIYPEDYTIDKNDLVRQWIAQGFINKGVGLHPEDVAESYFNELVNRSIIQPVNTDCNGDVLSCRVHDIMRDFILHKCREDNFITVIDNLQAMIGLPDKIRRLALYLDGMKDGTILGTSCLSQLRVIAKFGTSTYAPHLFEFKHLQVLALEFPDSNHLPMILDLTGLCHLFQLRYLKVVAAPYDKILLPRKIEGLGWLETLEIRTCQVELPSDIVHLRRLLHLILPDKISLPNGIRSMKSLHTLRQFNLDKNSLGTIRELGDLTNLRDLEICSSWKQLDDMEKRQSIDVLSYSLEKLYNLKFLCVNSSLRSVCLDALSSLSASHRLLQRLHLRCLLSRVPKWIGQLHNLYELEIKVKEVLEDDVGILAQLPSLIHLKLHIEGTPKENIIIHGMGFPVLKHFTIRCIKISFLTFLAGAMLKLQKLNLGFNAKEWGKYGAAPSGIEHLLCLKEVSVHIGCGPFDAQSDRTAAHSVLRQAIDVHPSRPTANISCDERMFYIFDDYDAGLLRKASLTKSLSRTVMPELASRIADDLIKRGFDGWHV